MQAEITHQPFLGAAGNVVALTLHLPPHLALAVDLEVGIEHPPNLWLYRLVTLGTW